ncbi:hypothetical protein I5509_02760 [Acinetobacter baumannii]|uniref:hypothetical protein n=1 Tax=Acinetobacter baumannii TaxID=470 RepID=UPI001901C812|nr:hypothetical protein [Acinetobacter baumannii]MBJ9699292.1 hypothetical protein [Acinetobacter baumannii]MDN8240795.1 hypothetical protein [Acinetobacter baumannii]HEM7784065.1 hypothetical protein [Acinetobacter baumannii]
MMSKYFDLNTEDKEYFETIAKNRAEGLVKKYPKFKKYNYRIVPYSEGNNKYVKIIFGSAVTIEDRLIHIPTPAEDTYIQDWDVIRGLFWKAHFLAGD